MKAARLIFVLALTAGTTAAFTVPAAAAESSKPTSASTYSGANIVMQNEVEKHRLESQGFPQYTD